jgi:high-affinity iron transporter
MIPSILITLREGIEAALIVGIVLSYVQKIGAENMKKPVLLGLGFGILSSIGIAALFFLASVEFEGRTEQIFEGTAMFIAAVLLTTVIIWMSRNAKSQGQHIRESIERSISSKESHGLLILAFVSVFREGVETVLFVGSASFSSDAFDTLAGAAIGLLMAALVGLLVFRYSVRLDLRSFFRVTGAILVLFAAGLVAHGIHEFEEAGIVNPILASIWNTNPIVDDNSDAGRLLTALFGYNGNPSLAEVLGYLSYWVLVAVIAYRDSMAWAARKIFSLIMPG